MFLGLRRRSPPLFANVSRQALRDARRHSLYEMQGDFQHGYVEDQRLVLVDEKYHIVTFNENNMHKEINHSEIFKHENASKIKSIVKCVGGYIFTVTLDNPNTIFLHRSRNSIVEPNPDPRCGHSSISGGKPVIMAGELVFGGYSEDAQAKAGELEFWNDQSGHYKVGSHRHNREMLKDHGLREAYFMKRIPIGPNGEKMLPGDKYVEWDGET